MALKNKILSVKNIARSAVLLVSFGAALMVSEFSHAQTTPCDPEYMQALEARAWLEMNREITQNQNLIAKPDSVLEYTCFNHFLDEVADNHGPSRQFSETDRWGSISGFSPISTNQALGEVVGFAFQSYINANFSHDYLGGRAVGTDYTDVTSTIQNRAYSCAEMATVWQIAKCTDFFEYANRSAGSTNRDGFMDFYWYLSNDPRDLPTACSAPGGMYNRAIRTAFNGSAPNRSAARYVLPAADDIDFTTSAYDVDNVVTHLDFIMFLSTAGAPSLATSCQTILTGITVDRVGVPAYDDAICPNPGCHLVRGSGCVPN